MANSRKTDHPRILLGVTGSIAAYKAPDIVRRLKERGASVSVVMTKSAQELITALTFESVSGNRVYTDMWSKERPADTSPWQMEHIDLARTSDLVLVAPASGNVLGKVAAGIADDLLTTVIMATRAPVVFAPAMNDQMWLNPVVQKNVDRLKELGYRFVAPEHGALACGTEGAGRLAAVETICDSVWSLLSGQPGLELKGRSVIVTTGRTEEEIDPVRVLTNRSSGRMGIALARAAGEAGAKVILVAGKTSIPVPGNIETVRLTSTEQMLDAVRKLIPEADILFMAAAPSDFRPSKRAGDKRKDRSISLELERTPDILTELVKTRHHAQIVGFSLESRDVVANARAKLARKNLDLMVANSLATLDSNVIQATLIYPGGRTQKLPKLDKIEFARRLVQEAAQLLKRKAGRK